MRTITRLLEDKAKTIEKSYLTNGDLSQIEIYAGSFNTRLTTYKLLRDTAEEFLDKSMDKIAKEYPALYQRQAARCRYDMTETLRYMAISILRNDEDFFRDQLIDWLTNILNSYSVAADCSTVYQNLQKLIDKKFPSECATLAKPYTDMIVAMLARS
ncbi:hypothetical protein [Pseudanabaena sp. PCC 6802]|uniref:hypothetical protein n=1 Tax=Pseudanabaena sp. PCC 6802 TaxID=118173 RepID=UPI00034A8304|nr:hypothetical protein [Pseudanabaena sp. PCC 6802]